MKQLNKIIPESIENECRNRISKGSKSFSLAAQILPASIRSGAFVIYAWCRRADDAIDKSELAFQGKALEKLSTELDTIFVQKKTAIQLLMHLVTLLLRQKFLRFIPESC